MSDNTYTILRHLGITAFLSLFLIPVACTGSRHAEDKARATYKLSLKDSVEVLRMQIDSCNNTISELKQKQDVWLRDFTAVSSSREVEPYIILSDFRSKYPPQSTGLIARLAENGQFELVASLGGARFTSITVTASDRSASSETVVSDQALNYMAGGLNTVLFTGSKADSIGQLIADNQLNPITVTFVGNGPVKVWKIPNDYSKMIMTTFQLYDTQKRINMLERRIPMLNRKISLLRSHIDK